MNLDWLKIRPFNGDIKNGFEELVCQLARVEEIKDKSKFVRVAAPDGGVEAYCILSNNDEYGWQAKYFSSMGAPQWTQIEESFKTAFEKHPTLKKYYVCTPLDRSDPRIVTKKKTVVKSFMDVWKDKVTEWESYALAKGRTIEFEYWGNSELFERLSKSENEGKLYYWFGHDVFSDAWFKQKLEESIINLNKRYTPELNFDLPIAKLFDGLSRDIYFQEQFLSHLDILLKNYNQLISHVREVEVKDLVEKIQNDFDEFKQLCEQIDFIEIKSIDQEALSQVLETGKEIIEKLIRQFYELNSATKKERKETSEYLGGTNIYSWSIEYSRKLIGAIHDFINFVHSPTLNLANKPFLFLTGEAGIGKSHLLADIAINRQKRNQFTILLLGQLFTTTEDPWTQISKLLQIDCKLNTFLSALNSKAESSGSRIVFLLDAINEGQGKAIWKNYLAGFISTIKRFPCLAVVFSLRTSYENLLIPEAITEKNDAIKIVHYGFANQEYEASKRFFETYQIEQPRIPLLHPEFSNPLFLKLFCEGLYKKGLHKIPEGYEGISTIINFYLESINIKISQKHNLPYGNETIQKVTRKFAGRIIETDSSYLSFDEAFNFIIEMQETKAVIEKSQFFQDLLSEGLLTQNVYWDKNGNHFEGVYLSYERFSDHLITKQLLDKFLNKKKPKGAFRDDVPLVKIIKNIAKKVGFKFQPKKLFELLQNQNKANYNQGIIEALSIQIPELINLELFEVAPHSREYRSVVYAFVDSIIWRKKETMNNKLLVYINDVVARKDNYHNYFIDNILIITSSPNNYFNSDFLHKHLMQFSMADRDSWWTQLIHREYPGYPDEVTNIRRMIDWAWTQVKRDSVSDESIRLYCQTMLWFLTSCNRTLRDSATKALICLLEERINVLIQLLITFEKVNDPYVLQRLYGVAYGCGVRTSKVELLKQLGDHIFQTVFAGDEVIPDILIRDYAKGIIEYAAFKGHKFDFDLNLIQPPYRSILPTEFPSNEEIDKLAFDYNSANFQKHYFSQNSILDSMVTEYGRDTGGYGDFGRYVFQRRLSNWADADENGLSNLAVKWIFEKYGYDVEKHGMFDASIGSGRGRENGREERIGKKYQWIALHEILARVSDNYSYYEDSHSSDAEPSQYKGPWEPFVRDIDPTVTIKGNSENNAKIYWWNHILYNNWNINNRDWVLQTDDLPNPISLINVADSETTEWLILEMRPEWVEPTKLGEEKYKTPQKRLVYDLSSHLVSKKDFKNVLEYLQNRSLRGAGLSESDSRYEMFSREYYWSDANNTFNNEYYRGNEWNELSERETGEHIGNVARTVITYFWEAEFDASKEETVRFFKPSELLFRLLDLQYSIVEGQLLDKNNQMICFDPIAKVSTLSCLLVKKKELNKVLEENELEIIWTSLGHKQVIGGNFGNGDYVGRLNISDVIYFDSGNLIHSSSYENE